MIMALRHQNVILIDRRKDNQNTWYRLLANLLKTCRKTGTLSKINKDMLKKEREDIDDHC